MRRRSALASAVGLVLVLAIAACSTPYAPVARDDAGDAGDGGITIAPGDAATVPTDASADGAPVDAADATPACLPPKQPAGATCLSLNQCCSNACSSAHVCVTSCKQFGGCKPNGNECCAEKYCSPNAGNACANCAPNGAEAEVVATSGAVLASSCCSGIVDSAGFCAGAP